MRALYVFTLYKTGQGFSNISKQHAGTLYLPYSKQTRIQGFTNVIIMLEAAV